MSYETSMSRLNKEQIKDVIIETLKPLGVERICLFGSFARNQYGPASDVDILVRLPNAPRRKHIGLRWFSLPQEISEKIGRPVDLVTEASIPRSLRPIIEKDLEVIYEEAG